MARLINDTKVLGDVLVTTGKEGNFDEVVTMDKMIEAIHVVQQQLGITGTTAAEAEGTITGSMNQVSAAWQNLLVGMADDTQDVRKLTQTVIDTVTTMLKNAVPRIKQIIQGMWKAIKTTLREVAPELANKVIPIVEKVRDTVKGLFEFISNNYQTILVAVKAVVAALLTFKIGSAIADLTSKFKELFATLAANPYTAIAAGIGLLVAAGIASADAIKKMSEEEKKWRAQVGETSDKLKDQAKSWEDLKKAQEDYTKEEDSKTDYYERLWKELQKITDENGHIIEGYEARATFITETLSGAMDIEIEKVGDTIIGYENLQKAMDNAFKQRRAQTVLNAQQALYDEAITSQSERLATLAEREKQLETARKNLDAVLAQGGPKADGFYNYKGVRYETTSDAAVNKYKKELETAQAELTKWQEEYDNAANAVQEGLYYIGLYEQNYAAAQEDRWDDIISTNWKYVANYQDGNAAIVESTQKAYDEQKILYDMLVDLVKTKNGELYEAQKQQTEDTLKNLEEQLRGYKAYAGEVGGIYEQLAGIGTTSLPTLDVRSAFTNPAGYVLELASAIANALNGTKVEMDGEEMGKFVTKTVTREIYAYAK